MTELGKIPFDTHDKDGNELGEAGLGKNNIKKDNQPDLLAQKIMKEREENSEESVEEVSLENALSRDMREGGYTFLHRVFRQNIDSGKPVVIDSGGMYFQYDYSPSNQSFSDGITVLRGSNEDTKDRFYSVTDNFGLDVAIEEGGYSKGNDGNLVKKKTSIFGRFGGKQ